MQCGVVGANDGGGHHNKKMAHCGDSSADISAYDIEFRSSVDDAWYSVRLLLDNDTLVVKFWAFPEGSDERYIADDFQTLEAIDEFVRRFRPVSLQLQDDQCSNVTEGTIVTACFAFKDDDVRFYDAMIEAVHKEKHSFAEGEEECLCSFVLFWQHGPNKGTLTYANVANICQIQTAAQLDSRVASFLKMAKVKSGNCSVVPASVYEGDMSLSLGDMCGKENCGSSIKLEPSIFLHGLQETIGSRQYVSAVKTSEGRKV